MADETRELAAFVANLKDEHVPPRMRGRAIDCLVDQIGCQLGGTQLPWAKQVREVYGRNGGLPEATVVGDGERLSISSTAFINSTYGHSIEFDDGNPLSRGHPGAELIPPLMAIAERDHLPGREFLTAFIAGYEVRGHIGWAVSDGMSEHGGPQDSTSCGPFGVAASVGKLLAMNTEGIRNALGIAGVHSGGLMQYDHGGGSAKRIYAAVAGLNGIQSAFLAQAGMTGPEGILEGTRGLLNIYSSARLHPERLVADLGKKWIVEYVRIKPYSSCGAIHASVDGFKKLIVANDLKPEIIESIEVGLPKSTYEHVGITSPYDLTGMQFSTAYSLALTILKGGNTPREYTLEALADPAIRDFASKVSVREDTELNQHRGKFPSHVKVRVKSGNVYEAVVIDPTGSHLFPLSSDQIDDKFRHQVADVLETEHCEQLLRTLRNIDALDDMAKLPRMLIFKNATANRH